MSKLPIDNVESCSHISLANRNESLTSNPFLAKEFNMGTKYVVDRNDRNKSQPSTCC